MAGVALAARELHPAEEHRGQGGDDVGDDQQGPGVHGHPSRRAAARRRTVRGEVGGVDALAADEDVEPVAEDGAGGGEALAPEGGEAQLAAVARPAGGVDEPVADQARDHPARRALARAEALGEVALGRPVGLGDVEEDDEAAVGQADAVAREEAVGGAVHEGDEDVELVGEAGHVASLAPATCTCKVSCSPLDALRARYGAVSVVITTLTGR